MFFKTEKEGQEEFFKLLKLDNEINLNNNTDGYYKGTIFEFKLDIPNVHSTLFQAIKYLSNLRLKGINLPKNILLISLNTSIIYKFNSLDFIIDIEKIYNGPASKNLNYTNNIQPEIINYNTRDGLSKLIKLIDEEEFTKINIDKYCVVGWAERFYSEFPNLSKKDLFDELRDPKKFKNFINSWLGQEDDFKYIMDMLNNRTLKKATGAFYTPSVYAAKSVEMVRDCIKKILEKNPNADYIILDRCAGTGTLEESLTDKELSHVIVNTYELKEWIVLNNRYNGKVRAILPTDLTENSDGTLKYGDALEYEVMPELQQYVDDQNTNIIVYENPPFKDVSTGNTQKSNVGKNTSLIKSKMSGNMSNELSNQFIWSAWNYYLQKENDFMIVYSPVKYWKSYNISDKKFISGYLFNRDHFHAGPAAISCIQWQNSKNPETKEFDLLVLDIDNNNNTLLDEGVSKTMKKCNENFVSSGLFSSNKDSLDVEIEEFCDFDGSISSKKKTGKSYDNENIIAYMRVHGFMINKNAAVINRLTNYNAHGSYLRKNNFIEKLPLFAAKSYITKNWYEKEFYMTTGDGYKLENGLKVFNYISDKILLRRSLIFTALSNSVKMKNLNTGQKIYKNELTLDITNGNTEAYKALEDFKEEIFNEKYANIKKSLNEQQLKELKENILPGILPTEEQFLIDIFNDILKMAKNTLNYNSSYNYGVYEIGNDLNTTTEQIINGEVKTIYDYPLLNSRLIDLEREVKNFYFKFILPDLFKYELLK